MKQLATACLATYNIGLDDFASLSTFQEALVRSAFDCDVEVIEARWFQAQRPCPVSVKVLARGAEYSVVLRMARNDGGVELEAALYPALSDLNLPVPRLLAGPKRDSAAPGLFSMSVLEKLPGQPLSWWARGSHDDCMTATRLLADAYRLLRQVTESALAMPSLAALPNRSALCDLEDVMRRGGVWFEMAEIRKTAARLFHLLERDDTPLMLSNGDFSPSNLLSDGVSLTGMVDFEKAAFVDPLSALARIPVYDVLPFSQTGFVSSVLQKHGFSEREFAPRVATFCLRTLQTKCPIEGGAASQRRQRRHVLSVLRKALERLDLPGGSFAG